MSPVGAAGRIFNWSRPRRLAGARLQLKCGPLERQRISVMSAKGSRDSPALQAAEEALPAMHKGNASHGRGLERGILCVVLLGAILSSSTAAQDTRPPRSADPATPSPAHERMRLFEGTWVPEPDADLKGGAKRSTTLQETCAWLGGGRRHMVCRTSYPVEGYSLPRESMYILSYREADSTYIVHFAFAGGGESYL